MITTLDWVFLGLLALSILLGLWRGLIVEVMSLGGWFIAGAAALYLAEHLTPYLDMTGLSNTPRYLLALVLIFITVLIVWSMLTTAVSNATGAIGLGAFDRLLGGMFGAARGAALLALFVTLISYTPVKSTEFWQTSSGVKLCQFLAQSLKPYLPASAAGFIP